MSTPKHLYLVFIYNSFFDPLCQGLVLKYVKKLANPERVFHFITFEQQAHSRPQTEVDRVRGELAEHGIHWAPIPFQTGRFLLARKALNLFQGFLSICALIAKSRRRPRLAIAFAGVAASMVFPVCRLFGIPLMVYSYEPHSVFLEEVGIWKKSDLKYRILNFLERNAGLWGDFIFTGTRHMVEHLAPQKRRGLVERLPTGVDESVFHFRPDSRQRIRSELNIEDRCVLIYPGKFGDLYLQQEVADFFAGLYSRDSRFFFLVLTGSDHQKVREWMDERNIPPTAYHLTKVPLIEVPEYLSSADVGLVAIANFPSRKYCSPTKVGEYLLCGLPYLVQQGTSEDDLVATEFNVGVVIPEFNVRAGDEAAPRLLEITSQGPEFRAHCREVGLAYRSQSNVHQRLSQLFRQLEN